MKNEVVSHDLCRSLCQGLLLLCFWSYVHVKIAGQICLWVCSNILLNNKLSSLYWFISSLRPNFSIMFGFSVLSVKCIWSQDHVMVENRKVCRIKPRRVHECLSFTFHHNVWVEMLWGNKSRERNGYLYFWTMRAIFPDVWESGKIATRSFIACELTMGWPEFKTV